MASSKKRRAPKSSATKPVPDEQPPYVLTLSKLAAVLNLPKKAKSAQVKQRSQHYIVMGGGSKSATPTAKTTVGKKGKWAQLKQHPQRYIVMGGRSKSATPMAKTTKSVQSTKRRKYIEVDAPTRQLAGAIKPSRKSVIRRGRAKLGAKGEERIRHDGHDRRDQLFKRTGSVKLDKPLRLPGVRKQSKDQGESRSTTKLKATWDRHRKLYIAAAVIGVLIGCAGVAVGVYFAVAQFYPIAITTSYTIGIPVSYPSSISASAPIPTTTTHSTPLPFLNESKGLLTYDAICVPHYQQSVGSTVPNVSLKECVAGLSPDRDSCSGNGTCATYSYRAILNTTYNIWTFNDTTLVDTVKYEPGWSKNATRLLCRTADHQPGLCDGRTCVNAIVKDDGSWYRHSGWVDNCEKPNPCWYGDKIDSFGYGFQPVVTRADCLSKNASEICRSYIGDASNLLSAVVWLQHVRCDAGPYSTTLIFCRGFPFRLWRCVMCNATQTSHEYYDHMCDKKRRSITSPCSFFCQAVSTTKSFHFYLPNGAECFDSTAVERKYCYGGACFNTSLQLNEKTRRKLLPHADCDKKKNR